MFASVPQPETNPRIILNTIIFEVRTTDQVSIGF